jgi:hypothetical protein
MEEAESVECEAEEQRQSPHAARVMPVSPVIGKPGPGRPRDIVKRKPDTPAEVRALLFEVLDKDTANKMIYSLRKKIARGSTGTLEFLYDRLVGRPAVNIHHDADGALAEFMQAWSALAGSATLDDDSLTIDGQASAVDDEDDART